MMGHILYMALDEGYDALIVGEYEWYYVRCFGGGGGGLRRDFWSCARAFWRFSMITCFG